MNMEELEGLDVEVKTIWSEMVKPLHPTPSHLKTFKLSLLDQMYSLYHNPTILFYSASQSSSDINQLMMLMKASLSKALSQFYPFAGRLLDDSTIDCNDQGVLLIHTQVTCPLKSYLALINSSMFYSDDEKQRLWKLLPNWDSLHGSHKQLPVPTSAWLQLAFQVNVFLCGGIVIGCHKNHKLLDGTSLVTFLQIWAGLCQGLDPEYLIKPNFDAALTVFPPYGPRPLPTRLNDCKTLELLKPPATGTVRCKAFVFKPTAISALRELIASNQIPHPTRVESVLGFLWKHCLEAEGGIVGPTSLCLTVNMRPRARPPFPKESMGNVSTNVVVNAKKNGFELVDLVTDIRDAINDFNEGKLVRQFQGDKGGEALAEHNYLLARERLKANTYKVSCQCRLGLTDVDFGFGKPILTSPLAGVHPFLRNFIILTDYIDPTTHATHQDQVKDNGILAWLCLDKKYMEILETNPDFLAFASILDLSSIN